MLLCVICMVHTSVYKCGLQVEAEAVKHSVLSFDYVGSWDQTQFQLTSTFTFWAILPALAIVFCGTVAVP